MKDYIIHIGLPKTASSFLQERIFPRFEGLNYVGSGQIRKSAEFNHLRLADDSLYQDAAARKLVDSFKGEKILLSEERFAGRFLGFGGFINRSIIARRLRDLMPNARILIFLRGQPAYIYSAYQQYIKGPSRGIKPFENFVHEPERYHNPEAGQHFYDEQSLGFSPHYVFYHELLHLYTSLFQDVKILLFEDFVRNPDIVLAEMEQFIKPTNTLAGKIDWNLKKNESVTEAGLEAIRYRNATSFMGKGILPKVFRELIIAQSRRSKAVHSGKIAAKGMRGLFANNNLAVIKDFSYVGIQKFPDDYPVSN